MNATHEAQGGLQATVIGSQGLVGRHLLRHLKLEGWDVRDASRDPLSWCDQPLGHVFHCTGATTGQARHPHDVVHAHVSMLSQLLHHAQFESLVFVSSTRLYDGALIDSASEDTPLALDPGPARPLHELSLALGEALCHAAGRGRARVARLACVYRDAEDADGLLPQLLRGVPQAVAQAACGEPPRLHVDSTPHLTRDYVHIDDVLRALVLIATRGTQPLYNVASGRNLSHREVFARLRELSGCEIVAGQRHIVRPSPRIDISRMRDEFGWCPTGLLDKLAELLPQPAHC